VTPIHNPKDAREIIGLALTRLLLEERGELSGSVLIERIPRSSAPGLALFVFFDFEIPVARSARKLA